jgi:uncharacterized membrane protein YdbT with pleckstrin-like domain
MTGRDADFQAIALRRHPVVLTRPLVETLAGLIVGVVVSETLPAHDSALIIGIWIAWSILLLRLIWKMAGWSVESLVITPQQLSLSSGLLSRKTVRTSMAKVTNMSLQESFLGRFLGYGELVLDFTGQDHPPYVIDHVPYSERLYLELCSWVMSSQA